MMIDTRVMREGDALDKTQELLRGLAYHVYNDWGFYNPDIIGREIWRMIGHLYCKRYPDLSIWASDPDIHAVLESNWNLLGKPRSWLDNPLSPADYVALAEFIMDQNYMTFFK